MDFTFCAIDIGITDYEKKIMLSELLSIPDHYYQQNNFRNCKILPIYNGGGFRGQREETPDTSKGEFKYTDIENYIKESKIIFEKKIFNWMIPIGRINLLRTQPGKGLNTHLDSTINDIGSRQHKFRLVLNGNIDKLFFLDSKKNKIYIPEHYDTYILDGTHPHSLDPGEKEKITLCIGKPWDGNNNELYEEIIKNSVFSMKISRPPNIEKSWIDPYFTNMHKGQQN